MSADKRSVHTDALETIGNVIETGERDAIHIAVEPVTATTYLERGEYIKIVGGKAFRVFRKYESHAIVDPFLEREIEPGEMFWALIHPRVITSLRHVWSHPDLPDVLPTIASSRAAPAEPVEPSEAWIREYAEGLGLTYRDLLEGADEYLRNGEYLCRGDLLDGEYLNSEFWEHYEVVRKTTVSSNDRGNFFTCSC